MTVKELIEILSKLDQEKAIVFEDSEIDPYTIARIEEYKVYDHDIGDLTLAYIATHK